MIVIKSLRLNSSQLIVVWKGTTPEQIQMGPGPKVYPFTTPGCSSLLRGSDAGSDGVEPALSFFIPKQQTSCSMWCPMYGARY